MKYQSNAQWLQGTTSDPDDITTDKHYTQGEAEGVCKLLQIHGFGGDYKIFPLKTWVTEVPE